VRFHTVFVACATVLGAVPAQAATYHLKELAIKGATSVNATALNDRGDVIGTSATAGCTAGFRYYKGATTTLPGTCASPFAPTGIDNAGRIIGTAGTQAGGAIEIVRSNGTLLKSLATYATGISVPPPYIAPALGLVTYNATAAESVNPFAGNLRDPQAAPVPGFAAVSSISEKKILCGQALTSGAGITAFIEDNGATTFIAPPGATATYGFISPKGVVGGYYFNATSVAAGFTYSNGAYSYFTPAGATDLNVTGINAKSQVAGSYTTADGMIHAFVYDNGEITTIGDWAATSLHAAINARGTLAIAVTNGSTTTSYLATP
jgi:probable HAF family extracellular repeat protein